MSWPTYQHVNLSCGVLLCCGLTVLPGRSHADLQVEDGQFSPALTNTAQFVIAGRANTLPVTLTYSGTTFSNEPVYYTFQPTAIAAEPAVRTSATVNSALSLQLAAQTAGQYTGTLRIYSAANEGVLLRTTPLSYTVSMLDPP